MFQKEAFAPVRKWADEDREWLDVGLVGVTEKCVQARLEAEFEKNSSTGNACTYGKNRSCADTGD